MGMTSLAENPSGPYDAIILAVAHKKFESLDIPALKKKDGVVYDVKGVLDRSLVNGRL